MPFFTHKIPNNCVLSSYLGSWWRHKLQDLSSSNLNGWEREKFEYLENEKSFLDKIAFFIDFEGLLLGEK